MRLLVAGLEAAEVQEVFTPIAHQVTPDGVLPDWAQLEAAVEQFRPDAIVLYLGHRPGQALAMARRVISLYPGVRIVALADHEEPELTQAVDRAGCADLAIRALGPTDLLRALKLVEEAPTAAPTANGQVIAVFGAKGGVGTTTIAVNLAAEVAAQGKRRVLLVDLHLFLGDAALALDIAPDPSLLHFLRHAPNLSPQVWADGPPMHRAGFRVLGLDGNIAQADGVTAQQVVHLLDRLRERHDYVLLDCGSDINEISMAALAAADRRLLVLTNEFRALLGARRRINALKSMSLDEPLAYVVLNRDDPERPADRGAIEDAAGVPVAAAVSNAWREVHTALQQGRVLREGWPKAQVTKDMRALAGFLTGESSEDLKRKAFFNLFGRD